MQEPSPQKKKQKIAEATSWYLYPPASPRSIEVGDCVFWRSKSAKELGQRATVLSSVVSSSSSSSDPKAKSITIKLHHNDREKTVAAKRLLPVFGSVGDDDDDVDDTQQQQQRIIIVTPETTHYRNLASSQLTSNDAVLEVGCSTGEASVIMNKYCDNNWIGFDTSDSMVARCNAQLRQSSKAYKVDAMADPIMAKRLVEQAFEISNNNNKRMAPPNKIFIDIGGNRDCEGVLRMIAWVVDTFSPTLVVIKSRELTAALGDDLKVDDTTGYITAAPDWIHTRLQQLDRKIPSHPLQAPLRHHVKGGTPICRYHNYHKDGCKRFRNGNKCDLDHDHCHMCQKKGHTALQCPQVASK